MSRPSLSVSAEGRFGRNSSAATYADFRARDENCSDKRCRSPFPAAKELRNTLGAVLSGDRFKTSRSPQARLKHRSDES